MTVELIERRREKSCLMKLEFDFSPRKLPTTMPDPEVAAAIGDRLWSRAIVYGSELAERFFAATHKVPCKVRVGWTFTKRELDAVRHLVLVARKVLGESSEAVGKNRDYRDALPPALSTRYGVYKVREKAFVSDKRLKPDQIACLDLSGVYVVPTALGREILAACGGFELGPVLDVRTEAPIKDMAMLIARHFFPEFVADALVRELHDVDGSTVPHWDGPPTQSDVSLEDWPALSRDRRPEDAVGDRGYIVTQDFRQALIERKVRGVNFEPVLVEGSDQHQAVLRLRAEFNERLAVNPANRLR